MKILAIDTSTDILCLGMQDERRSYGYSLGLGRRLSCLLMPTIKRAIDAAGWRLGEIGCFACGLGPGSFTGLRLGLAAMKGMAWALNKPLLGVHSLDILAEGVKEPGRRTIAVASDAKRDLVYYAAYKREKGRLRRISPYMLFGVDELIKAIKPGSMVLGNAAGLYREKIADKVRGAVIMDEDYWRPQAHNLIELAVCAVKHKRKTGVFGIRPVYLYPKECQVRR